MKIKNMKLMLLGLLAMGSMNAFAQTSYVGKEFAGANGVRYKILTDYAAAAAGVDEKMGTVTVTGYSLSETEAAVTIPEIVGNLDAENAVPTANRYKVVAINGMNTIAADLSIGTILVKHYNADPSKATGNTQAFKNAKSTSITLPTSVLYIGQQAFEGCEATTIVIPAGSQLAKIDKAAFANAKKLATFATENATWLAQIDEDAFYGCAALTSISLGAKLEYIKAGAFVGTKIATLDLSACVLLNATNGINRLFTASGTYASTLNLNTTTTPGSYVNADATNASLTTVVLPTTNAVAYPIGANAFDGCTKLATIGSTANAATINAKVASIGEGAFLQTAIKVLDLSANAKINTIGAWFSVKPDDPTKTDPSKLEQVILNKAFDGTSTAKTYTINTKLAKISTLAKIGTTDDAFQLPKGVTLATGMFAGTGLTKLDLSKYDETDMSLVALFGDGISTLTEVKLNAKTTELADLAFYNCTGLTTLNNIDKLKIIGDGAFYRTAIASFAFGADLNANSIGTNKPFVATAAKILKESDGTTEKPYSLATSLSIDLSKSANVKTIAANAFKGMSMLTSVKLPTTLEVIGTSAFEGTGITEIELPASMKQTATAADRGVRSAAFKDSKLKTVKFYPTEVTSSIFAADDIFSGCALVSIYTTSAYAATGGVNVADAAKKGLAPTNSKWVTSSPEELTTVKDKVKNYAMKGFYSTGAYQFDAAECDVYEAYLDGENIVLSPLRKRDGKYNVPANCAVIVRTAEVKTINPTGITIATTAPAAGQPDLRTSAKYFSSTPADNENCLQSVDKEYAREAVPNFGNYMYVLVNNATAGFSFQYFSGTKINKGNIYVINPAKVPAAGRLNMIWLDENGNVVEDETTAIESINATEAAEGEIYNLQGVRVNGAQKGIYIKNGKKFIVK